MDKETISIRKLTVADLPRLKELSIEIFHDSFAWGNTEDNMKLYTGKAFADEQLLKELQDPFSTFYFAMLGELAIGYLKLNTGKSQTEVWDVNSLEIERIYIQKQYQGRNIGKKLLDKALEIAKNEKAAFIWLGVWEKNPGAIRFYERNGFGIFSSHSFMLGNDKQTDILMKWPVI